MTDAKIHFMGCMSAAKLDESQRAKLNALVESCPSLLALHVYPNLDTTSEENIPSGIAMYFPMNAKVDSTILSDSLFQTMCVSKVLASPHGKELDDEHFVKSATAIGEAVDQFPKIPVTGDTRHPVTNQDKHQWSPELGGEGSFVGAYYQMDTHREKAYYLVARGTVPLVVRDLKALVAEDEPTFAELLNEKKFRDVMKNADYVAHRNVQRNLANVAEALQVSILRTDDIGGKLNDPHESYRERACPQCTLDAYTIRATTYNKDPAAVLYNGVVPSQDLHKLDDQKYFVVENPNDGIHVVRFSKRSELAAVPIDTGRSNSVPKENAAVRPKKSSALKIKQSAINQGIVWENQKNLKQHPDLVAGVFQPLGKDMKLTLRSAGWDPEEPIGVLVCMAAKIYNPALKRP